MWNCFLLLVFSYFSSCPRGFFSHFLRQVDLKSSSYIQCRNIPAFDYPPSSSSFIPPLRGWNIANQSSMQSAFIFQFVCLFVYLYGLFRPTREFFTHKEISPLPVKGCKFWPILSTHRHWTCSEGSLACHTYCDTGHQFIMVIS